MEKKKAARQRGYWGEKACDHRQIVREYEYGIPTEGFVCMACGTEFTADEYAKVKRPRPVMGRPAKLDDYAMKEK
jgi:hypothetical protein